MAEVVPSELIDGVYIITPQVFDDDRGFFVETYRREWIPKSSREMLQANRGDRQAGCVVGSALPPSPSGLLVCAIWNCASSSS